MNSERENIKTLYDYLSEDIYTNCRVEQMRRLHDSAGMDLKPVAGEISSKGPVIYSFILKPSETTEHGIAASIFLYEFLMREINRNRGVATIILSLSFWFDKSGFADSIPHFYLSEKDTDSGVLSYYLFGELYACISNEGGMREVLKGFDRVDAASDKPEELYLHEDDSVVISETPLLRKQGVSEGILSGISEGRDLDAMSVEKGSVFVLFYSVDTNRRRLKNELGFEKDAPVVIHRFSYFEEMEDTISEILEKMDDKGFSDSCIKRMRISLTEIMVNAVKHGNSNDFSKVVTVGYTLDTDEISVSVMDEGEGFEPGIIQNPTTDGNIYRDHGRGIFIAKQYLDRLEYNAKGNVAYMSMKLR
ncbi:MAG: ATP-binding protein [Chitinivibrionales bacterium]